MNIKKHLKGFSLVELLVVITIIAILSVTAFVALGGQTGKARDSRRQQDLATIQSALELYFIEFSRYPVALQQGLANGDGNADGLNDWLIPKKFLSTIPTDPNGQAYHYVLTPGNQSYEIAATLENEGAPNQFETYIVGNRDPSAIATAGGRGRYYNPATQDLGNCMDARTMDNGVIADTDANGNCIPYDPR